MSQLTTLIQDTSNANKGTKRGNQLVEHSLREYGAGRSILIDKNGRIIAGNRTAANAQAAGLSDVIIVQSDGTQLIAVQRTDLDLNEPKAKALAVADNRTSELGLEWDPAILGELSGEMNMKPFFTEDELADALGEPVTDVNEEYVGMPEYVNEDQSGVRDLIVHFKTEADAQEFAKLVGQTISPKTKYIWYPRAENVDQKSRKYHETV